MAWLCLSVCFVLDTYIGFAYCIASHRIAMVVCTMCVNMILQNNKKRKMCNGHLFAFHERFLSRLRLSHTALLRQSMKRKQKLSVKPLCSQNEHIQCCVSVCEFLNLYAVYAFANQTVTKLMERWKCIRISSLFSKFISHCILHIGNSSARSCGCD